jgi:hypothetical protein
MVKRRDDLEDRNRIRRREIECEQEGFLDRAHTSIHHNGIELPLVGRLNDRRHRAYSVTHCGCPMAVTQVRRYAMIASHGWPDPL